MWKVEKVFERRSFRKHFVRFFAKQGRYSYLVYLTNGEVTLALKTRTDDSDRSCRQGTIKEEDIPEAVKQEIKKLL